MTETIIKPQLVGTVSFNRKVGLSNYSNVEAGIFVQFAYDSAASAEEIVALAAEAFVTAKATVFEQLGLKSSIDAETGVLTEDEFVEAVKQAMPGTQVVAAPSAPTGASVPDGRGKIPADVWADIHANPQNYFNNTATKTNPKAPDYKRKADGKAYWLG